MHSASERKDGNRQDPSVRLALQDLTGLELRQLSDSQASKSVNVTAHRLRLAGGELARLADKRSTRKLNLRNPNLNCGEETGSWRPAHSAGSSQAYKPRRQHSSQTSSANTM